MQENIKLLRRAASDGMSAFLTKGSGAMNILIGFLLFVSIVVVGITGFYFYIASPSGLRQNTQEPPQHLAQKTPPTPIEQDRPTTTSPTTPPTMVMTPAPPTGINLKEAAAILPVNPSPIKVKTTAKSVVVRWNGVGGSGLEYRVYRKIAGANDWQQLGTVKLIGDDAGEYEFTDTTAKPGLAYIYGIENLSSYGRKNDISESSIITGP